MLYPMCSSQMAWRRWIRRHKAIALMILFLWGGLMAVSLPAGRAIAFPPQASQGIPAAAPAAQEPSSKAVEHLRQGIEQYQTGQFQEAIARLQDAVTAFAALNDRPSHALALSYLASAHAQLSQWPEANQAIAQAGELLPLSAIDLTPRARLDPAIAPVLAQVLNTQGILSFNQGHIADALATWQSATAVYRQIDDETGLLGSQINQARALRSLGNYRQASEVLGQARTSLQGQPDSLLKVIGLQNLGAVLQLTGDLNASRTVLEQSLAIAQALQQQGSMPNSGLPLAISGSLTSQGDIARLQGDLEAALQWYRQAEESGPVAAQVEAQSSQLAVLAQRQQWSDVAALWQQMRPRLADLPANRAGINTRIYLAQTVIDLTIDLTTDLTTTDATDAPAGATTITPAEIARLLATAIQDARAVGDRLSESAALGTLGHLYEQAHQWNDAQAVTQQALALAQAEEAPELTYQWQWQLGRLARAQGPQETERAIAAYTDAVKTLRSLRNDLVGVNTDLQFSFRESVEPVYRQLVELLVQSPQPGAPSQANLKQAREVIESLQLAELDNFFREACLNSEVVEIDQIDTQSAVIYPILLPNRLAIILSLPNQPLTYAETVLPREQVDEILTQMRQSLRETAFVQERLPIAQRVYDLLVRPIEPTLVESDMTNLVFVLDSVLGNLPMAALHDGQHYLIENYSVSLAPGLQLLPSEPLKEQRLRGLIGGLSESRQGFPALPFVNLEITQVQSKFPAQVLMDQSFTNTAFAARMDASPVSIVHLATHGQFSSDANDTFVLTWDDRITVKELDQLLRNREGVLNPVELLVLSACETATGDRRAALGMAGVAVRSGARSTLASLWAVSDRSTTSLMTAFYQALDQPGITKTEALRQAQLTLLQQPEYENPYYWAPFVLLGNWL